MIDNLFLFKILSKDYDSSCKLSKFFTPTDYQNLEDLRPWVQILLFIRLFVSYAVLFIPVIYLSNFTVYCFIL